MTTARRFRLAALIAWLILTVLSVPVVAAPFLLPATTIARWTPVCQRKARSGQECLLCGMTRAFLLIGQGNPREATHANRGSLPLFLVLLSNQLLAVGLLARSRISYN